MRYIDIKRDIACDVQCYQEKRFDLLTCIDLINKDIRHNTNGIPQTKEREQQQRKLYRYAFTKLLKVIPEE